MTFVCHGCGAQTPGPHRRKGRCKFCYSKGVSLCRPCAFWELGPPPRRLPDALRPRSRKQVGTLIKRCPAAPVVRDANAANLVVAVRAQCATVNTQWASHGFDADGNNRGGAYDPSAAHAFPGGHAPEPAQAAGFHAHDSDNADGQYDVLAQAMLDDYDNLYARPEPVGGAGNQAKADNDLERVMLLVLASAHERCGYINDRLVHRWDAPAIAAFHFTQCFAGFGAIAAAQWLGLAPDVLGSSALEDLVSGKLSVAYAYWRVCEEVPAAGQRQDFVRLSAMLLHLWLKNAPQGAIPPAHNFQPHGARGVVTPGLVAATLKPDRRAYRRAIEKKLSALYGCFGPHPPPLPAHARRFHDANVHNNALLTPRQQRFLQSLPRMDSNVHGAVATPCEHAVRARVRKMLKRVRAGVPGAAPPGVVTQQLVAANSDAARDAVIDTLVATLHSGLNWLETSSGDRPFTIYDGLAPGAARANFDILSFAAVSGTAVPWTHVFPDCMGAVAGNLQGQSALPDMLHPAYVNDGRQNARRWYPQWRWDKDHRLYGGQGLTAAERGMVTQFTFHPRAPYPNLHYGVHSVVWDPALLERSVLLLGDKGRPVRSRLLLLHDMVTVPPDVLGDPGVTREATFRGLLEFADANAGVAVGAYAPLNGGNAQISGPAAPAAPTTARTVLLDRLAGVIARDAMTDDPGGNDVGQRVITEGRPAQSISPIVECHVLGRTNLHQHAWLVIVQEAVATVRPPALAPAPVPHAWVASLIGGGGGAHPPFNTARYHGTPPGGGAPYWQVARPNPLPDAPGHPPLSAILAKVPTHS